MPTSVASDDLATRRIIPPTIVLLVGVLFFVSLAPLSALGASAGIGHVPFVASSPAGPAVPSVPRGNDPLTEARASLAGGHGPAAHERLAPIPGALSPPAVTGVSLAYDATDGYVVALAPNVSVTANGTGIWGNVSQTWTFASGNWTNLNLTSAPPNRNFASMANDVKDGSVVLFGGDHLGGAYGYLGRLSDTWTFANGTWTNITGTAGTAPAPRAYAPMVWDASDGYAMLFGGCCGVFGNVTTTTVWGFVGGTWTSYTSTGTGPQNEGALAYDAADGVVLYFGGAYSSGSLSNETWSYHAGSWTSLVGSVAGAPPPRALASMAYDPALGAVVLFGGNGPYSASWHMTNDTWTYLNLSWTLLSSSSGPSPRYQAPMVYDVADNELVLFGGDNQTQAYSDTWVIAAGNNSSSGWTQAAPVFGAPLITTDVGVATTLFVHAAFGGTSAVYSYSGLPPGCLTADTPHLRCVPQQNGTYAVTVTVNSTTGIAAASMRLVVNPALTARLTTSGPAEVGQSFLLTASTAGGTGSPAYSYLGLPAGCASANRPDVSCAPGSAGSFTIRLQVTDQVGGGASASTTVTVAPGPAITSVTVAPSAIDLTQSVSISMQATGGTAPYSVVTAGLPAGCAALVAMSTTCQPTATGTFSLTFTLTDRYGVTATGAATLVVNAWPAITSFAPSAAQVVNGSTVTFATSSVGGTGSLSYVYYGLPTGCASANRSSLACTPTEVGNFTVEVTVADGVGGTTSAFASLEVAPSNILPPPHHTGGPSGGSSPSASASGLPPVEAFALGAAIGIVALAILAGREVWRQRITREGRAVVQALRDRGSVANGSPAPSGLDAESNRPPR